MAVEQLLKGCGYMGHEFGARYLDAACYGGRLWDEDNCDDEGNLYEPSEYIPCPACNHAEALKGWIESATEDGYDAHGKGKARKFPTNASKLKYPKDYQSLKKAWLEGWDLAAAETVSLRLAPHPG